MTQKDKKMNGKEILIFSCIIGICFLIFLIWCIWIFEIRTTHDGRQHGDLGNTPEDEIKITLCNENGARYIGGNVCQWGGRYTSNSGIEVAYGQPFPTWDIHQREDGSYYLVRSN